MTMVVSGHARDTVGKPMLPWEPGALDIHQISTGRGNAGLYILPDGTTLLVDAGEMPVKTAAHTPDRPDATRLAGERVVRYIRHALGGNHEVLCRRRNWRAQRLQVSQRLGPTWDGMAGGADSSVVEELCSLATGFIGSEMLADGSEAGGGGAGASCAPAATGRSSADDGRKSP